MGSAGDSRSSLQSYLVFTVFITGGVIMVVELLGSRVIGPSFGVSLFVWTSLITVTLISLSLGYWLGGRLADIKNTPGTLYAIILGAGLYLVLIPYIKGFVLAWAIGLGIRTGALVSSIILFGPPLYLLGMVTPFIVKLKLTGDVGVGATVGRLYAISTAGSVIGTIITGFILIPALGVDKIIFISSLALIILTAIYWIISRTRSIAFASIVFLPVILMSTERDDMKPIVREDGTKVTMVSNQESVYGQVKVVDYTYEGIHLRELLLDNIIQGGVDLNKGLSLFKYQYYLERLAHAYNKDAKKALVIGLGPGIVPARLSKYYGMTTDVVEIDPVVLETAKNYFNYDPGLGKVYLEDGRYYLRRTPTTYDVMVLDAFSGDIAPSHLMSMEAFELMEGKLSEDGVLLINFLGSFEETSAFVLYSLNRTLKNTFAHVDVYTYEGHNKKNTNPANFIFVAYNKERSLERSIVKAPVHPPVSKDVDGLLDRKMNFTQETMLLTDDYNPIDYYDVLFREKFRLDTIRSTDRAIIIN